MAKWKQQKLGNPKILEEIGERADQAIEAVNTIMGIVKTGGEVAKLVLMSSINPALLAMKVVGEAIIDIAGNYREAGFYALYVGYGDGSTAETFPEYGLAYSRDEHGNYMFENAYFQTFQTSGVINIIPNYSVNANTEPKFVKSLKKEDLSNNIRDSNGRDWRNPEFVLPMPKFDSPWRFVRGGWTPDKWYHEGGGLAFALPNFPQIPATKVVQAMVDAFDDEGDVALYGWVSDRVNVNLQPVYTKEGIPIQNSKQQYARIGSTPNPGGQLSDVQKLTWEISEDNWELTHTRAAFYTHLYNKKESLRPSTLYAGSSTYTTLIKTGKPAFKGVGDITIPAETKLVKTGTAGEKAGDKAGAGGTLGSSIGTYEVVEIKPAYVIPIPSRVVGIAIVAGLADFQAFYNLLNTLMNFFGEGWTEIKEALSYIESLTDLKYQNIQLEQDTLWGSFDESKSEDKKGTDPAAGDRYMMGATSGAVGKIMKMNFGGQSEDNRIPKLMSKYVIQERRGVFETVEETVDTNAKPYLERWFMHEYKIESVPGEKFEFDEGEYVYQISEKDGGVSRGEPGGFNADGEYTLKGSQPIDQYWLPSTAGPLTEEFLENKVFKGVPKEGKVGGRTRANIESDIRSGITDKLEGMAGMLPPYGIVTGASFENPPASVPPDFMGFQFKEFIPYWTEVFDGIAMFGQAIVDIAEALLAFIQKIIEFIDKVIGKLQKLANAIISFINYFKIGIPEQGIYLLGVSTSEGNAGIQNALRSAENAPPKSLVYSSGILLVGVTDNTGTNGVEILGQLLALDFTDAGSIGVGKGATAIAELQGTGFVNSGITTVYEDEASYTDAAGKSFHQIKSFTVNTGKEGSGYATIPSITIASSGSVTSISSRSELPESPKIADLRIVSKASLTGGTVNTPISVYVEPPTSTTNIKTGESTYAAEVEITPAKAEVPGIEEVLYKDQVLYTQEDADFGLGLPSGVKVGDEKTPADDLLGDVKFGDVKTKGQTAEEATVTTIKLKSPGSGYTILDGAPKIYIGGGGKNTPKKLDIGTPNPILYHTILTTRLSTAPKARAILEGDKITKISLDTPGTSYFITDDDATTVTTPLISIGGVPLKSIELDEHGRLYKEIPRLSFDSGSGSGFGARGEVISLDIKGSVEEIKLTSPGQEYKKAPEIKISKP